MITASPAAKSSPAVSAIWCPKLRDGEPGFGIPYSHDTLFAVASDWEGHDSIGFKAPRPSCARHGRPACRAYDAGDCRHQSSPGIHALRADLLQLDERQHAVGEALGRHRSLDSQLHTALALEQRRSL